MQTPRPPRLARWLVAARLSVREDEILDDLDTLFADLAATEGPRRARWRYWQESLSILVLGIGERGERAFNLVSLSMYKSYLLVAWRTLRKHKGYALLNTLGLALGLACCLLILLFVQREWSSDRHFAKADCLVRAWTTIDFGAELKHGDHTAYPFGDFVETTFPEVEAVSRAGLGGEALLVSTSRYQAFEENLILADPNFLDFFDLRLTAGDPATALATPYTVVLTETFARRYFGSSDPVGQSISIHFHGQPKDFMVTGIVEDAPAPAHFSYSGILSYESNLQAHLERWDNDLRTAWNNINPSTYLLLREGADWEALDAKMTPAVEAYVLQVEADAGRDTEELWFSYHLQPVTDIHLGQLGLPIETEGDLRYLYIFSIIAALILLIACINYINLATAQAATRAREVGVRKVFGARRWQLGGQFLMEALLLAVGAFGLALALVALLLPLFEAITGQASGMQPWRNGRLLAVLFGMALGAGLLAGSYPALLMARFEPLASIRGFKASLRGRRLRQVLVVTQFACGVVLIIGTLVISRQLDYISEKKLGFDEEQVVSVPLRTRDLQSRYQVIQQAFDQIPGVLASSIGGQTPKGITTGNGIKPPGAEESIVRKVVAVDPDYDDVLGIEMAMGRWFEPGRPTDSTGYLINEAALRTFGLSDPIGQELNRNGNVGSIIGVVRDFHFASLHHEIEPLVLHMPSRTWHRRNVMLKIAPGQMRQTLPALEAAWQQVAPDTPFTYTFLDDDLAALYATEQRLAKLFGAFAGLGILVACLGLFGLAAFTTMQRTKEVGIRKVLGASVPSLLLLLSKEFLWLVGAAFLVATPLAYFAMERWLQDFSYRIDVPPTAFLLAGAAAVLIALATVSYQALRTATANPVKALRYE